MPFQSTHPLRGATRLVNDFLIGHIISIHAPLAGCDGKGICSVFVLFNFNPRTPCGVRRPHLYAASPSIVFQSTHPLRGATISSSSIASPFVYFNPRTPCGVRHIFFFNRFAFCIFQSTHPLRGATACRSRRSSLRHFNPRTPCGVRLFFTEGGRDALVISIHAPLAGCDPV